MSVCGFQITVLCRLFALDTNETKSPGFIIGITFIEETFSFKLGMSLKLSPVYLFLLEACPLL